MGWQPVRCDVSTAFTDEQIKNRYGPQTVRLSIRSTIKNGAFGQRFPGQKTPTDSPVGVLIF